MDSIKPYPVNFCVCNALKIKPFQALLRNIPFCSLGEAGGAGAEPPQNLPPAAEVVQTVLPLEWSRRKRGRIFLSCSPFSAAKWQRQKSRRSRGKGGDFLLRKKYYSALTVWIVGTDIERGLFSAGKYAIIDFNRLFPTQD